MTLSAAAHLRLSAVLLISAAAVAHVAAVPNGNQPANPVPPPVPEGYNSTPVYTSNQTMQWADICKESNDTGCTEYSLNEYTSYCEFQGNNTFTNITKGQCVSNTSCNAVVTCADPKNIGTLECHQGKPPSDTVCNCFVYAKK